MAVTIKRKADRLVETEKGEGKGHAFRGNQYTGGLGAVDTNSKEFKEWFGDSKAVGSDGKPLRVYHGTIADVPEFDLDKTGSATTSPDAKMGFFFFGEGQLTLAENEVDTSPRGTATDLAGDYTKNRGRLDKAREEAIQARRDELSRGYTFAKHPYGPPLTEAEREESKALFEELLRLGNVSPGGNIMPLYLSIKNPKVIDTSIRQQRTDGRTNVYGGRYLHGNFTQSKMVALITEAKAAGHDGVILRNFEDGARESNNKPTDTYIVFEPTQIKSAISNTGEFSSTDPDIRKGEEKVQKAESILRPFASFMDSAGNEFMNIVSALHTSRVSAYGFIAEAEVLGIEEYQITEQLDSRVCPVCAEMHGKVFSVSDAREFLDVVVRATDPDDLKQLAPWPSNSKDGLASLREMSNADLVSSNWHTPPYHPGCRGLLTRVGRAPPLDSIKAGNVQETYEATKEDFKAMKVYVNEDQIKLWNENVGLAPAEVIARLTGVSLEEFLQGLVEADDVREYTGITSFSIAKNITIRTTKAGFGSDEAFDQGIMIHTGKNSLQLDALDIAEDELGSVVSKRYLRELYTLAKDMGKTEINLVAGGDVGGYAWAKYGFVPTYEAWEALKMEMYGGVSTAAWNPYARKAYEFIMASSDPSSLLALSDLPVVGRQLLAGTTWAGKLDLASSEAITRFLSYIGELS